MHEVLYTQHYKAFHHMKAMEAGWPDAERLSLDAGRLAPPNGADRLHIVGGLQFGALDRMRKIRAAALPYIFYDRAYFGGGPRSDRLRITAGAYQKHWIDRAWGGNRTPGRAAAFGVTLRPWRHGGGHILLVPPGEAIRTLFGLGDWEGQMLARLKRATQREVRVSYKGDPAPLEERLHNCHCVVTWTSNVAVDAIVAGVPAFTSEWSAAAPVAWDLDMLWTDIEMPRRNGEREIWAESLAWGQFTLQEIASGLARSIVMEAFSKC